MSQDSYVKGIKTDYCKISESGHNKSTCIDVTWFFNAVLYKNIFICKGNGGDYSSSQQKNRGSDRRRIIGTGIPLNLKIDDRKKI